jgi:glycosyltransferase involved in cell wall biosynthesis
VPVTPLVTVSDQIRAYDNGAARVYHRDLGYRSATLGSGRGEVPLTVSDQAPRVSVCIPTYNRSAYLRQALDSALAQTFGDFELLVVDDGSPDDTGAVAAEYARRDPRVRYVRNPTNLGMVGNWNRCVALARGEYVALLHDDDLWAPGMLAATAGALAAHPAAAFAYGAAEEIDDAGVVVGMRRSLPRSAVLAPAQAFAHLLAFNSVPPPAILVRASAYAAAGGYDPEVGFTVDWDLWLRLASRYPVVYVDQIVARYRLTDASNTKRLEQEGRIPDSIRLTIRRALAAPPEGKRPPYAVVRRGLRWAGEAQLHLAFNSLYAGDYAHLRKHTRGALTSTPELIASPAGLAALTYSIASLFGSRGPRLLSALRDLAVRRLPLGQRSASPSA